MRLLVLTSLYPPHVGGAPALVERFVTFLRGAGDDVDVLTWGATGRAPERRERVRLSARSALVVGRRVLGRERYDGIVCGAAYPCSVVGRIVRTAFRTPFVVYVHGEDVTAIDVGSPRVVRAKRRALAWSLRGATKVFVNSRATLERVRAVEPRCATVEILPPCIDPETFDGPEVDERAEELRARLELGDADVLLLVARLTSPRKGHDVVVRALPSVVARGADVRFVVVGEGDQTRLRELAAECGVAERLSIIGAASDEELPALMRMADVYVMPSRWDPTVQEGEGFGIVYLEAAAAGRPTIAGNTGGSLDAVVDGVTGITVDAESPDEVAAAISALLDDPARARALGAAGRARVGREFATGIVLPRLRAALQRSG
jgi:phosphatidylinositol alpha-1,6-mannosyltransferase